MQFEQWFEKKHPEIPVTSAKAVVSLIQGGATIPFIARYRKEATQNLNEVHIETVADEAESWEGLLKRQQSIVKQIEAQGQLTEELKNKILSCFDFTELDDIFQPYRKKRTTKAQKAKDRGLQPLADWIWDCAHDVIEAEANVTLETYSEKFVNKVSDEEKAVNNIGEALAGAGDILAERLADLLELRQKVRTTFLTKGELMAHKGDKVKPNSKFEGYFKHEETVASLIKKQSSHRYLALRRGQKDGELKLELKIPDSLQAEVDSAFLRAAQNKEGTPGEPVLTEAAANAYKNYVLPSIENEVFRSLKESADAEAIKVFADNVRKLLLAAPFGAKSVLGIDPGIRTGSKLALIDDAGKYTTHFVIQLEKEADKQQSELLVANLMASAKIDAIAVGNGTAGRETEHFIRETLKKHNLETPVVMVSESGASVYSASAAAREEFPELDVTVRGAISIARRLQDPLAELVKIEPKSIGVGQYQHDVSQAALKKSLDYVVEGCVNSVGVDLNTASYHLLSRVAGIGPTLSKNIVTHREKNGVFKSKSDLMKVEKFGEKAFEQAAGFLRVKGAKNPLENSGVHPEQYKALENFAKELGKELKDLLGEGAELVSSSEKLKEQMGPFTFEDVITELKKPGRDPRDKFVPFSFHPELKTIGDLKKEVVYPGIVTNVTNFGAFVDVGVHQDGLVHLSELADKFVKDAAEVVSPGDRVSVKLLEVNVEKKRVSFTMRTQPKPQARPKEARQPRPKQDRAKGGQGQGRPDRDKKKSFQPRRGKGPQKPRPPKKRDHNETLKHNPFAAALLGIKVEKKK